MKILHGIERSYIYDPTRYFDFGRFSNQCSDFTLIEGFIDFSMLPELVEGPVAYLEFEEPNRFVVEDPNFNHIAYEPYLNKIFTICPYTAEWLNKRHSNDKRTPVFFPFNEQYIVDKAAKQYDAVYSGHIHSSAISEMVGALSGHNYCLISGTGGLPAGLVTHPGVDYKEKIKLIAESKISIVHNLLYLNASHINQALTIEGIRDNEAFKMVQPGLQSAVLPQLKSRVFEAAFGRSLILCLKDRWNIIERFFEPDREFLYYEEGTLDKTLSEVIRDYENYRHIAERAFERACQNYTTEKFAHQYLATAFQDHQKL